MNNTNLGLMNYHVGKPKIFNEAKLMARIEDILKTGIYSNNGPYCNLFERSIQEFINIDHCVTFANATLALEAVFSFIKSKVVYGQVLVPSFTFIASVNSIVRAGLEPIFVDVDNNYCMDLVDAIYKSNSSVVGCLPCNLFGNQASIKYEELGYCVYDSAHAFNIFNVDEQKMVGNFGFCEVFSMHPTKAFGTLGELGFVTTKNDELADYLRKYRNFGYEYDKPYPQGKLSEVIGTNAKASEVACAAALGQLEDYEEIQDHYYKNIMYYANYLPEWIYIAGPNQEFSNFSYVVCQCEDRDRLVEYLHNHGVFARTYFQPVHKSAPYIKTHGHYKLPNTERLSNVTFCLPTGLTVTEGDISRIAQIIRGYK